MGEGGQGRLLFPELSPEMHGSRAGRSRPRKQELDGTLGTACAVRAESSHRQDGYHLCECLGAMRQL